MMWIFDECEILEDDDFKLVQDGGSFSLEIREVYPEDAGVYICRLIGDNDVEVECAAKLHVKGNADIIWNGREIGSVIN